jgi:EmrB/QacA subfamily drug resistance transporter
MSVDTSLAPDSTAVQRRSFHPGLVLAVICGAQLMIVLDATIVNIALPSIQRALHFSTVDLAWVLNAYTLAFGGLLLLGGRAGDLFGQRRMFVIGVLLFAGASFLGGLATSQAWLLASRALQGVGGAIASPAGLSLITTSFPEGRERNRAVGAYAAVSGSGAAIGLMAGGILTDLLSWRWVFFVNVPIGLLIAFAAPRVLGEARRRSGRLDLPGAITSTAGMTLLVYGLIRAATRGWGNTWTVASFAVAAVLLIAFIVIETRHEEPLVPLHLFKNTTRAGSYLVTVTVAGSLFAMFYFLTLFVQDVLGYSPLKAGFAFLPVSLGIIVVAGISSQLVRRVPAAVLMGTGSALAAASLLWLSRITPTSTFTADVLGPSLLLAVGMGLVFVPLTLTAVYHVAPHEAGAGSALLNACQQVGGTLGLAILVTVATTATKNYITDHVQALAQAGAGPAAGGGGHLPQQLATAGAVHGWSTAFLVGAAISLAGVLIAALCIRVRPSELNTERVAAAA